MDLTHNEGTRVYADFYGLEGPKVFSARAVVLVEGVEPPQLSRRFYSPFPTTRIRN
jgi:hypothetical protein